MLRAFVLLVASIGAAATAAHGTTRPVVGIFSAPLSHHSTPACSSGQCDYVAASYVKWLESAGARSLPIPYNSTTDQIKAIFPQINGVLFPGGGADCPASAKFLFQMALAANEGGEHFPVWGTCLGFEWILEMVAEAKILEGGFDSENISMPLNLEPVSSSSLLYGAFSAVPGHRDRTSEEASRLRGYLSDAQNPPTMNNHQAGLTPSAFAANPKLTKFFDVLSTNKDRNGRAFVSTIEGARYPVYGVQWHPEKNNFEWGTNPNGLPYEAINHSPQAVFVSQTLANFFVSECRRNSHILLESTKLFWDYEVSQITAPEFEQCYLIPPKIYAA